MKRVQLQLCSFLISSAFSTISFNFDNVLRVLILTVNVSCLIQFAFFFRFATSLFIFSPLLFLIC
nr:MAG TPA: hypothetical protein [Caudoviricetes sp.]